MFDKAKPRAFVAEITVFIGLPTSLESFEADLVPYHLDIVPVLHCFTGPPYTPVDKVKPVIFTAETLCRLSACLTLCIFIGAIPYVGYCL